MLQYWTQRDSQSPAVEYAAALLLCSKMPSWLEGMTTPALSFRKSMTAPCGLEETQVENTDRSHHQPCPRDCNSQQGFMHSRDYNLLVGMIEMLCPEVGRKLYGMKLEELEAYARKVPRRACPYILLWFCKLLRVRMELSECGEYVKMDEKFLEEEILDNIAQFRLDVIIDTFVTAADDLRGLEVEAAAFEHGTGLLANSCGFRLPQTQDLERSSEKTDGQALFREMMQAILEELKAKGKFTDEDARIAFGEARARFYEEEEQWLENALRRAWPHSITAMTGSQGMTPALRQRIVTMRVPEDAGLILLGKYWERHRTYTKAFSDTEVRVGEQTTTPEATEVPQQTAVAADVGQIASRLERLEVDVPADAQQESSRSARVEEDSDMYTGQDIVPKREHGLDGPQ